MVSFGNVLENADVDVNQNPWGIGVIARRDMRCLFLGIRGVGEGKDGILSPVRLVLATRINKKVCVDFMLKLAGRSETERDYYSQTPMDCVARQYNDIEIKIKQKATNKKKKSR